MKKLLAAITLASIALVHGCALYISTEYLPYEGKDQIIEGEGGTKAVVDGMEVWSNGAPPRKFKVIGLVNDQRKDHILLSGSIESDAVEKAKAAGGDALILLNSQTQVTGYSLDYSSGDMHANSKRGTSFAVIKFYD